MTNDLTKENEELKKELAELRVENERLAKINRTYHPNHKEVMALRQERDALKSELDKQKDFGKCECTDPKQDPYGLICPSCYARNVVKAFTQVSQERDALKMEQERVIEIAINKNDLDRKQWCSVTEMTVGLAIKGLMEERDAYRGALEHYKGIKVNTDDLGSEMDVASDVLAAYPKQKEGV